MFGNILFPANREMKKAVKKYNKYSLLRKKVFSLDNISNTILNLIDDHMYEEAIHFLEKRKLDIEFAITLIQDIKIQKNDK